MKQKKIILFILLLISCLSFELLFCNSLFLSGKSSYVYSFARIFLYIMLFIIETLVKDKIINNRIEYEKEKKKITLIDIFLILSFIFIICVDVLYIILGKTNIMSQGIIIILLCYIVFIYLFYSKNYKLNIILLCSICFIYSMVITPKHAIDENTHFISSYNIANFDYNWGNGYIADSNIAKITKYKNYIYNEKLFVHYKKKTIDGALTGDKPYSICKYLYIPSSIGIFISEKLNGTIMDIFYIGRFMNSMFTIFLISILLKIVKYNKNSYIAIITTPYFLFLGSAYNIDAIGSLFILIFIAYILNIYNSKTNYLNRKNILIITLLMFIITLYKGASYFLIFFLLFIIKDKIPKKYKWITIVYFIVFSILIYLFMKPEALDTGDVSITGQPNPTKQLKFLFSSPLIFIKVYGLHFINCFFDLNYYEGLLGTYFYPFCSRYFLGFYLLYIIYMGLDSDYEYSIKEKIFFVVVFLLIFFFTSTGLYLGYTGVGRIHIEGYQSRYLFPILPLILMILSNKKINILKNKDCDMFNYGLMLFLNIAFIIIIVFVNAYEYWR